MRSKAVFIVGAGLGYALGTRAGREQLEKLKGWTQDIWADPRVQAQVSDLAARATEFAKTEGSTLKETVTGTVQYVVDSLKTAS